jgi:hypothetical protein
MPAPPCARAVCCWGLGSGAAVSVTDWPDSLDTRHSCGRPEVPRLAGRENCDRSTSLSEKKLQPGATRCSPGQPEALDPNDPSKTRAIVPPMCNSRTIATRSISFSKVFLRVLSPKPYLPARPRMPPPPRPLNAPNTMLRSSRAQKKATPNFPGGLSTLSVQGSTFPSILHPPPSILAAFALGRRFHAPTL